MPKKILEDIKPLTRTRRVSATRRAKVSKETDDSSDEEMDIKINSYDSNVSFESNNGNSTRKLSLTMWLVTFASLVFLFIVLSSVFVQRPHRAAVANAGAEPLATHAGLPAGGNGDQGPSGRLLPPAG